LRVGNRFAPASSAVAGRCTSRPPPRPWAVASLVLEVFLCRPHSRRRSTLMTFASSSERSRLRWNPSTTRRTGPRVPPLMVFPACASPPYTVCASTPGQHREAPPFGSVVPSTDSCSALVVSHHLGDFLHTGAAGLLHPASGLGVHRVSDLLVPVASEEARGAETPSPRCGLVPFEGFPSPAAVPHHCDRCPLAVAARPTHPEGCV
jgi:hypothetical protein